MRKMMNGGEYSPVSLCLSSAEIDPSLIGIEHAYSQHKGFGFICDADKLVELFPMQMFILTSSKLIHL